MADTQANNSSKSESVAGSARLDRARYRPIRIIGLLLILQAVGLIGLVVYEFALVDWQHIRPGMPSRHVIEATASILFVVPAALAFVAALSFLILSRRGWLLAAISQGLGLGICLWLFSELKPGYVYPVMIYCALMVFYLNSRDVRSVFHSRGILARHGLGGQR